MTKETKSVATTETLSIIPINAIQISETNKMFRDESDFTPEALKELSESILSHGLISPITVRPTPKPGGYILVAGERRLRASKFAGIPTIACSIRLLNDEQAFDIQLTENLERKDIHPMREARAYKHLQETKGWSTAEIATRFAKGETYVLQRLRLNTLIPEAARDFEAGFMSLGHALVIARLQEKDQKDVVKALSVKEGKNKYYEHIGELEDYISHNITMELKKAPFDLNDATLLPAAGACSTCPKRSSAQSKLFADVPQKDCCFDPTCYEAKSNVALYDKVKELVGSAPDTIFLKDHQHYGAVPQQIASFLSSQKIKPIEYNEYESSSQSYNNMTKRITGFMLNGHSAGKEKTVYIKAAKGDKPSPGSSSKPPAPGEMSAAERKDAIARIKERSERNIELDAEKVYARIMHAINPSGSLDDESEGVKIPTGPAMPEEIAMIRFLILDRDRFQEDVEKLLKLDEIEYDDDMKRLDQARAMRDVFLSLTDEKFIKAFRYLFKDGLYNGQATQVYTTQGQMVRAVAAAWGVPVNTFELEQAQEKEKREGRAAARIEALQNPKPKKQTNAERKAANEKTAGDRANEYFDKVDSVIDAKKKAKKKSGKGLSALLEKKKPAKKKAAKKKK